MKTCCCVLVAKYVCLSFCCDMGKLPCIGGITAKEWQLTSYFG